MGTINDDGCHKAALNDEPIFTLLARDPCGPDVIRYWMRLREAVIGRGEKPQDDHQKLDEAAKVAQDMVVWRSDATDPTQWPHGPRWTYPRAPEQTPPLDAYLQAVDESQDDEGPLFEILDKRLRDYDASSKVTITAGALRRVCGDTRKRLNGVKETISDQETARSLVLSKLGVGLRQVTGELSDWVASKNVNNTNSQRVNNWIDRLNGYASEAAHAVGWVTDEAIDRALELRGPDLDVTKPSNLEQTVALALSVLRRFQSEGAPFTPGDARRVRGVLKLLWSDREANFAKMADIPQNVYWGIEGANFYDLLTHKGMGQAFYNRWHDRSHEFPQRIHDEIDMTTGPRANDIYAAMAQAPDFTTGYARVIAKVPELAAPYTGGPVPVLPEVTATPELPPHRFTMFDKTERWAYGRGLEINPAHIPAMLERMEDDGWYLYCVVGGVERDKFGMIFRRKSTHRFKKGHDNSDGITTGLAI